MKGQDLLLLLKLVSLARAGAGSEHLSIRALEASTGISKAELCEGMKRCRDMGLLRNSFYSGELIVNTTSLMEFLSYGVRYALPARLGAPARGLPTAYSGPAMSKRLVVDSHDAVVWASGEGECYGPRLEPLFHSAPYAAHHDEYLHALLSIVDSIRIGRARELGVARELLSQYLQAAPSTRREATRADMGVAPQ